MFHDECGAVDGGHRRYGEALSEAGIEQRMFTLHCERPGVLKLITDLPNSLSESARHWQHLEQACWYFSDGGLRIGEPHCLYAAARRNRASCRLEIPIVVLPWSAAAF